MKVGLLLHGGAAVNAALALHPTDRDVVLAALACNVDVIVVEAVAALALPPRAATEALALGAGRAVRLTDSALDTRDGPGVARPVAELVHRFAIDVVLFGEDADPEGATDVPGALAYLLGAHYLAGVDELTALSRTARNEEEAAGAGALLATVRSGGRVHRVRVPAPAVVGLAPSHRSARASSEAGARVEERRPAHDQSGNQPIEVLTLAELGPSVSLVRRPSELRGALESAPRPLVTLQSAARLAALLGL